ncbi:hypothetical protein BV898_09895 [Hypsibius exemplaris]|uniref:Uncharacterized protein n=1 Tax=Hypsibius exemplaris TaxID=2072580 RepID=A0A1W0WL96_HYPEX|nr:hypothetical protein BV898_09895 [Hypsibius exemplaris]
MSESSEKTPPFLDYKGTKVMHPFYETLQDVEKFQTDPKDVCICGNAKSGTCVGVGTKLKPLDRHATSNNSRSTLWKSWTCQTINDKTHSEEWLSSS